MRGDILDTKEVLAKVLRSDDFLTVLDAVRQQKIAALSPNDLPIPDPIELRVPEVYTEERMSKQLFPMCELLAYHTTYANPEDLAKIATHRIGLRWTTISDDEGKVTKCVELLMTATVELLWNPLAAGYLTSDYGLNAGSVLLVEEDYSPLLPNQQGAFLKGGVVIAEITTYRS